MKPTTRFRLSACLALLVLAGAALAWRLPCFMGDSACWRGLPGAWALALGAWACAMAGLALWWCKAGRTACKLSAGRIAGDAPPSVNVHQRMEVMGRLAGRFAHEFNNQLGIISNSAYLIGRRAQDPRLTLPAQAMLRAVETASELNHRLQRLGTRNPSGAQPLDLGPWLRQLEPSLAALLGKRMVLELKEPPQSLRVHVAHDELELAVISVLLCLRETLPDGAMVVIEARPMDGLQRRLTAGAFAELSVEAFAGWAGPPLQPREPPAWAPDDACHDWGLGLAQSLCRSAGGGLWAAAEQGHSLCASLVLPQMPADLLQVAR
ncbi:Blue-light-activated protein [Delftia tsuruhatensis]|uniref:hypothetical protein n=1 Tax=Delftia tsuruhatensis TaxID=180282 RepID=UPI001E737338|nr:hypothetical protein [Delftia tsuruhatensis]CAB5712418.1 Blue-light-activated protein [Delftia tsuruhatensis]CAC9682037.1 Blue-light-activated protein [Delftia tsuruhatensis]